MSNEKSLSEKREILRWQIEKRKERDAMRLLLNEVEKQDKEAVRRVEKEAFIDSGKNALTIKLSKWKKIFGPELI